LEPEKSERIEALNGLFCVPRRKMGETVARVTNGSKRTAAAENVGRAVERRDELIAISIQKQA
jgi:hypothetical protein